MSNVPFGFSSSSDDDDNSANVPGFDLSALGQMFSQLGAAMSQAGSSAPTGWLNTEVAQQLAWQLIGDTQPASASQTAAVRADLELAEVWLDPVTSLPAAARTAVAWSPAQWVEHTMSAWTRLCTPIAERSSAAYLDGMPEQMRAQLGPVSHMMQSMGAMAYGSQLGQALGVLSQSVLTSTDLSMVLGPPGTAALMPAAIAQLATDIGQDLEQLRLYLAAREAATHRLFGATSWLTDRILDLVARYAAEITVDTAGLQELAGTMDLSNLSELQEKVSQLNAMEPQQTAAQVQIRGALETLLDLIDGWVETVVVEAIADRIRSAAAISEALRRRRVTSGPAEMTFAALAGLEFRPKRQRAATCIWQSIGQQRGSAGRDAMWTDPNLLPVGADLDDPDTFINGDREFAKLLADLDDVDLSFLDQPTLEGGQHEGRANDGRANDGPTPPPGENDGPTPPPGEGPVPV